VPKAAPPWRIVIRSSVVTQVRKTLVEPELWRSDADVDAMGTITSEQAAMRTRNGLMDYLPDVVAVAESTDEIDPLRKTRAR
jgi:hypothetical protein